MKEIKSGVFFGSISFSTWNELPRGIGEAVFALTFENTVIDSSGKHSGQLK